MNAQYSPALHQSIDAFRAPALYLRLREHKLPEGMLLLLRIAAGDSQAIELGQSMSNETGSAVSEAAVMFIQHLMFYPGSSSFRVLGVEPSASDAQIKEHYRWLVRWLHPDRNADEWDAVYAERVTLAWQDLRTPDRRLAYEESLAHDAPAPEWIPPPAAPLTPAPRLRPAAPAPKEFVLSARTVRRLPAMILAGFTLCAAAVLGLQYYPVQDPPAVGAEASDAGDPAQGADLAASAARIRDAEYVASADEPAMPAPPAPVAIAQTPPAQLVPAQREPAMAAAPAPMATAPVAQAPIAATSIAAAPPKVAIAMRPTPPAKLPAQAAAAPAPPLAMTKAAIRKAAAMPQTLLVQDTEAAAVATSAAATVSAPSESTAAPVAKMDEAAARDVILRFRSAYASGNLNQVRSLLARNSANLEKEQAATLKTYRKLFESSVSRHMEISNPSWLGNRDSAILVASFEAWIQPVGKSEERRVQGDIRFDLQNEDGQMRIIRVRHMAKGG